MINPKVSVIIPIYNGGKYLKETIESVLSQTYLNFELILVNDGSTDETEQICKSYADNRVLYKRIRNSGVSVARNVGFAESNGEYVSFLDADDVWLPKRIEKSVEFLVKNEDYGFVHTDVSVIDSASKAQNIFFSGLEGWVLNDILLWEKDCIHGPSSVLFRKNVLLDVGLFDNNLSTAADQEIYLRVSQKYQLGKVSETLCLYRVHGQNMHFNIKRMETEHVYTYNKAAKLRLFKNNSFERTCYSNLYFILAGSYWVHTSHKSRALLMIVKSLRADFRNGMMKLLNKIV